MFRVIYTRKSEEDYNTIFFKIKVLLGRSFHAVAINVDFELALLNAISWVFPDSRICGCLFHFKQAVRKWIVMHKSAFRRGRPDEEEEPALPSARPAEPPPPSPTDNDADADAGVDMNTDDLSVGDDFLDEPADEANNGEPSIELEIDQAVHLPEEIRESRMSNFFSSIT